MELYQALLLGLLQGIAEWLPISSSGQTMLALTNLLGVPGKQALSISFILHLGSMLAVVVYFRKKLADIVLLRSPYAGFLAYSTLATAVIGIPLYFKLQNFLYGSMINKLVGASLIVTGVVIRISKKSGEKSIESSGKLDAYLAGIAQGIAVIPGISRSGLTIASLLSRRFNQSEALTISFLISIPAILGANLLNLAHNNLEVSQEISVALLASFLASMAGMKFLLEVSKKLRFDLFCMFFGSIALIL